MSERQHAAEPVTADALGSPPTELSAAIERLLGNPELISTVASAMGIAPKASATEADVSEDAHDEPTAAPASAEPALPSPDALAAMAPLLGMLSGKSIGSGKGHGRDNDKACLLRALKPYVSHGRREAIDAMIRISEISDLLKAMQR